MNRYKLLTPGPLTTTRTVKEEMLLDRCTWDDEYKQITQEIRGKLLAVAGVSGEEYTTVLLQGSGSFGVEAVLTTAMKREDKCLLVANGAYGERMIRMAEYMGLNHTVYRTPYDTVPEPEEIRGILSLDKAITHVAMIHCETTSGIINPLAGIAAVTREYGKTLIVDAMSSFGGLAIPMGELGIDFLISSANKCIQGVPGFCFVIARLAALAACEGNARSLSFDLYDQWKHMDADGKWRYTSPTHVVAAFARALDELALEGGVAARSARYRRTNSLLRRKMKELGFAAYIAEEVQSPIITTFLFPYPEFKFDDFYRYVKDRGYVLYPGKLTDIDTFRIGNIGEIYETDILRLCDIIEEYMGGTGH